MQNFKYFSKSAENAVFSVLPCQFCGTTDHCLEGLYFDQSDDVESICIKCLKSGEATVFIPLHIQERLVKSVYQSRFIDDYSKSDHINNCISELSKTPPVPWIQYNDWPVCCADFLEYLGEWSREMLTQYSSNNDGKTFLLDLLDDFTMNRLDDFDAFWNSIGTCTAIFVFKCKECGKLMAIAQSY